MENISWKRENTFLSFRIEKEIFALSAENVIEVIRNEGITPVPKTADYIAGVINFRGDILSVVCARKKLNIPDDGNAPKSVIVIIEYEVKNNISKLGFIVDKVIGVLNIKESEIQPVLEFGNYYNPEFLKGAICLKENIITILNIEKIFSTDEIEIIKKVKEESSK